MTTDDTETVAFTLENFHTLETKHPNLAKHLHTYIIEMLAGAIKRQVGPGNRMPELAEALKHS